MQVRTILLATLLIAAGLAGCIGDDGGEDVEPTTTEPNPPSDEDPPANESQLDPAIDVSTLNGTIRGASTGPAGGYYCDPQGPCDNTLTFDVSNATAVVLQVAWDSGDSLWVNLDVPTEYCQTGPAGVLVTSCPGPDPAEGQSPLRIEVTDPSVLEKEGEWTARAWVDANTPTEVAFSMWATVIHDGTQPGSIEHTGT